MATVEINNELVELESREAEEVHRSPRAGRTASRPRRGRRRRGGSRDRAGRAAGKGAPGGVTGAVAPEVSKDGRLELLAARHPLLMKGVVSRYSDDVSGLPDTPTPVDIKLVPPATALLITGPNTGARPSLKTAGSCRSWRRRPAHLAEPGSKVPVFVGLRRHRRRAVDRRQPQHVRLAHHERRVDGSRSRAACARPARRDRRGHGSPRRRRARRGDRRSLSHAGRARRRDDALRRAEDVRGDDARSDERRVRIRSRELRADVSPRLRIAREKPRTGDGGPPWPERLHRGRGEETPRHASWSWPIN